MLHCNMTMLERYELLGPSNERFGNPAPLGLLGLAIACGALVPIALGTSVTPSALASAAVYALLFGGGCQLLAGLMIADELSEARSSLNRLEAAQADGQDQAELAERLDLLARRVEAIAARLSTA